MKTSLYLILGFCLLLTAGCKKPGNNASISNSNAQQPSNSLSSLPKERVSNGERIINNLRPTDKGRTPDVSGFEKPSVRLVLAERAWKKLSKSEQIDITYYAQSLISVVRGSPGPYLAIPPQAPAYKNAVEYAREMCDDCWEIMVGQPLKNNSLSVEETVVQGDIPWERADPCCRGAKGSVFRQLER
jgi:hypothetical protein